MKVHKYHLFNQHNDHHYYLYHIFKPHKALINRAINQAYLKPRSLTLKRVLIFNCRLDIIVSNC